jgi:hypothetical protein
MKKLKGLLLSIVALSIQLPNTIWAIVGDFSVVTIFTDIFILSFVVCVFVYNIHVYRKWIELKKINFKDLGEK